MMRPCEANTDNRFGASVAERLHVELRGCSASLCFLGHKYRQFKATGVSHSRF